MGHRAALNQGVRRRKLQAPLEALAEARGEGGGGEQSAGDAEEEQRRKAAGRLQMGKPKTMQESSIFDLKLADPSGED